jgi:hypothetical protein
MLERFAIAFTDEAIFNSLETALRYTANKHRDLEKAAKAAAASGNPQKIERVFETAIGIIIAEAQSGQIKLDKTVLVALRGIKFDHQHGTVTIGGKTISAEVLVVIPDSAGATG